MEYIEIVAMKPSCPCILPFKLSKRNAEDTMNIDNTSLKALVLNFSIK
jgi:hypothetical protein